MDNSNIARNLRLLRTANGYSTAALSEAVGMVSNKISHIENGRRVKILQEEIGALCSLFNISPTDLIDKKATITFI